MTGGGSGCGKRRKKKIYSIASDVIEASDIFDVGKCLGSGNAAKVYAATHKQSGRRLTFEWALIAGQNDDVETAAELARLLKPVGKCHVNLIPLNPTKGFDGKPASLPNAEGFVRVLESRGIPATVRVRRGIDIDAGCGQLAEEASKEIAKERLERKLRNARERIEKSGGVEVV